VHEFNFEFRIFDQMVLYKRHGILLPIDSLQK